MDNAQSAFVNSKTFNKSMVGFKREDGAWSKWDIYNWKV